MSTTRFLWSISALPIDRDFRATEQALTAAVAVLSGLLPGHEYHAECHSTPRFYGSEGFSSSANCPTCGSVIDRKSEDPAHSGRRSFAAVDMLAAHHVEGAWPITMPACGHVVALSDVGFEFSTASACCAAVAELSWWVDGWLREDGPEMQEALAKLSEAMGTPVHIVCALHLLLPSQRMAIERLMSADDAERLAGAQALETIDDRERDEDDYIHQQFIEDHLDALRKTLRDDTRPLIRHWALGLLAGVRSLVPEFLDVLAESLRSDDEELLKRAMRLCGSLPATQVLPMLPLIRALHTHPASSVRMACAQKLRAMREQSEEDRLVIRTLALDPDLLVKLPALHAMRDWINAPGAPMERVDRAVLEEVLAEHPSRLVLEIAQPLLASVTQYATK